MPDSETDLHAQMLGGPFDTLSRRVGTLLRNRVTGLAAATRGYSTYRSLLLPPLIRPESLADVAKCIATIESYIDKSGALRTANPTRLNLAIQPEFGWNGYQENVSRDGDLAHVVRFYNASRPLQADFWQAVKAGYADLAKRLPAGWLLNTAAAIDTGRVVADGPQKGLKIGENRGFAIMSGATGSPEGLEYGKYNPSKIDGWVTDQMMVQPVGTPEPTILSVADVTGRRGGPVTIGFAICKDFTEKVFPMKPDLLIVPAAGGSPVVRPGAEGSQVIICDALHNRFFDGQPLGDDLTAAYTPAAVAKYPYLASVYRSLNGGGSMADVLRSGVTLVSGISPAAAEQTMLALQRNAAETIEVEKGVKVVLTEERSIPVQANDAQITATAAKTDAGTANIIDPAGTAADPAKEDPAANPFFDGEGPGELDAAGPPATSPAAADIGKAVPIARFGALAGRLAGYLPAVAAANPSQADPQHFVLNGDGLSSLGDAETACLKQAYDAGKSITLLHPASTDVIAATFAFLHGSAQPCPCADPIEIIDAWMIQRDRNGGFRQTTLAVPMRQVEASAPVATRALVAAPALGATPAKNAGWERDDSEAGNTHQSGQLMAALRDAETRSLTEDTKPAPAVRARLLGASVDPVDFIKEVQNVCDVFTQSHTVDGQGEPTTYTVTNIAIPVSCLDNDNKLWDYYYLAHQAVFSCGGYPAATMDWYDFNVWTEQSGVTPVVIVSSPQTTEGQTTTTSSTSLTVGGNLGFFGDTATGGMSVSGTWSKSTSYSSPDVLTENKSDASHVMWTYYLSNDISHTTFQPYMQEVFRFDRSPEAKQANSPFKTLAKIVPHDNHNGIWIEHWFNAPVPPAPQ
ncbi:Leukocidin/Hemolysin toxin family protein [Bosea sp. CRIB-10]|uniref:leukocidin family pore-forming toxin n=1 Tax=Bosea sp. CRIB-10 TaxID=378404 RepID=UPI0008F13D61|nr:leukocidin family pore-forming toxin [Bosea sp. CRIB-10]SFD00967.1 Leukocidin/Hemolysin toxin family protein [Bosea sp. CRIB-10]